MVADGLNESACPGAGFWSRRSGLWHPTTAGYGGAGDICHKRPASV